MNASTLKTAQDARKSRRRGPTASRYTKAPLQRFARARRRSQRARRIPVLSKSKAYVTRQTAINATTDKRLSKLEGAVRSHGNIHL
jgi:hypothetical protein